MNEFDVRDYAAKYADQYQQQSFETTLIAIRRRIVLETLARYEARSILEVGCGLEPLFLSYPDFDHYTVVEPVDEFVRNAQSLAAANPGVRVVGGFFEDEAARLKDRAYDVVVVSSLLHEVADPQRLLTAIREVCGAGTIVHFNVPNMYSFHRLLALEMGLIESIFEQSETEKAFQRKTRYDAASLEETLRAAGFQTVESGSYFIKPFSHAQMDAMLRAGIVDERLVSGLDRMTRYLPDMGCEIFANARRGGG